MKVHDSAASFAGSLKDYQPTPTSSDRAFWTSLSTELKNTLLAEGEAALKSPLPVLRATDYLSFLRSGNRLIYENPFFERRHLLNALVVAECIEDQGRFLDSIIDFAWAICEESTWCLPAHNSYLRDHPQEPLPDTGRPVLDLFACETGAMLAMLLYLMEDKLDSVTPLIGQRLRRDLSMRIIEPYLTRHFWWMGQGDEPMCNWTPWCSQNILLTAFLVPGLVSESDRRAIFLKAAASCDFFLKDYGEDGCCDEGAQYFRHAGLCLFACLDLLNQVSDRHFESLYADTKIRNIAAYISNIHIAGPYYFNFADCSARAGLAGVREYLFGRATGQSFIYDYAACDVLEGFTAGTLFKDESMKLNLFFKVQAVCNLDQVLAYARETDRRPATPPSIFYESVGIWTARDSRLALAVKSGDNDDNHNHNDVGSLIVYKDGLPILVDIGVETYTRKTFSPERYEIWTMQSCYHNLPTISGLDQLPGATYRSTDLTLSEDDNSRSISMDISTAYPAGLSAYTRQVTFHKATSYITLADTSEASDTVLNFISYEEPVLGDHFIKLGDAGLEYTGAGEATVERLPITDPRLQTAWDHDLYRIRLVKQASTFSMTIR